MTKDKKPNFLLVGTAKAGTTSLYHYLNQHPDIFMSDIKEPKFITSQFLKNLSGYRDPKIGKDTISKYDDYLQLFRKAKREKILGEASVDTLYYAEKSIPIIKKYLGDPYILIILRNPVDRAFSVYLHMIRDKREVLSFEEAIKQESERIKSGYEFFWHYVNSGFYYKQVRFFVNSFSKVKVVLFEDLKKDVCLVLKEIYEFLKVDSSFCPQNINFKFNKGGVSKNGLIISILHEFLIKPNQFKEFIKKILRVFLTKDQLEKLFFNLMKITIHDRMSLNPKTRSYLVNVYKKDIVALQTIINRDLSHWLKLN